MSEVNSLTNDSGKTVISKEKVSSAGKVNDIRNDNIGGSPAGGVAGSGGVSTTDVGRRNTTKQPLTER